MIEDQGLDADERSFADRAAVQHGLVSDADFGAQDERNARVGVQNGTVLNIRPGADGDHVVVAANDRIEPDRGFVLEDDAAHDSGVGSDEMAFAAQLNLAGLEREKHDRCDTNKTRS